MKLAEADRHSVYRAYDASRRLLYIGITGKGISRMQQHADQAEWWDDVRFLTVEHVGCDRTMALRIEREAIVTERPLYNKVHAGWVGDAVTRIRDEAAILAGLDPAEDEAAAS